MDSLETFHLYGSLPAGSVPFRVLIELNLAAVQSCLLGLLFALREYDLSALFCFPPFPSPFFSSFVSAKLLRPSWCNGNYTITVIIKIGGPVNKDVLCGNTCRQINDAWSWIASISICSFSSLDLLILICWNFIVWFLRYVCLWPFKAPGLHWL